MLKKTLAALIVAGTLGVPSAGGAHASTDRAPVLQNVICNDGTPSPTCKDCHRGCCSHHGGCT